jgi:hypothetical protein
VPAIMEPIAFYMRLGRIPWWPLTLIIIKILDCLGLYCVWATKPMMPNMRMSSIIISWHYNKDTNSSTNFGSFIKKVIRFSW